MAFDHSRRRWFGTCSCKPVPRGLPSSVKQLHTAGPFGPLRSWHTIIGITRDLSAMIRDLAAKVTGIAIQVEIPSDVLFEFDKSDIRPAAAATLAKIAELIKAHPGTPVQIDGHTDALGSDARNLPLSQQRAASVKKWLAANGGIEVARMAAQGWGKTKPAAPNTKPDGSDNPEGRQKNRRVEITIKTK